MVAEEARVALFLTMFAILGWRDLRTREADDRVFAAFGCAGAAMYLLDWQDVTQYTLLVMICTAWGAILLWKARMFGTGDLFAVLAGAVIYPVYGGVIPTMLLVLPGGWAAALAFAVSYNAGLNASDIVRHGRVFADVSDGRLRKCAAFFLLHRQRRFERHAFCAEEVLNGRRRLNLGMKPPDQEFAEVRDGQYVEYACPLLLFAAAAAFVLLAEQLVFYR